MSNRVPPRIRHDERPLSQRGIRQPPLMSAEDKAEIAFRTYHHKNPHIFAAYLDASDTTPALQQSTECLACWLDDIRYPWRDYRPPNGVPTFCQHHAYGTL